MSIKSINPYTGQLLKEFNEDTEQDLEIKLQTAHESYIFWSQVSLQERVNMVKKLHDEMTKRLDYYAKLITEEVGKPFHESKVEVEKCNSLTKYYLENALHLLTPTKFQTEAKHGCFVQYDPLGVILGVQPWNFPFWQAYRFIIPTILAGNAVVIKHASNVPQTALSIEESFEKAGFKKGVVQILMISSSRVEQVLSDRRIKAVSLTGSEGAGSAVGAIAGRNIKKSLLELGGNDPFIVMPDADLDKALLEAENARLRNAGQACNSPKRYILHNDIADEFIQKLAIRYARYVPSDPYDENTLISCLASEGAATEVYNQVYESIQKGAVLVIPNSIEEILQYGLPKMPAMLLDFVNPNTPAYHQEIFGPVGVVIRVGSFDEALKVANDSDYGLAASVWTKNKIDQQRAIKEINSGNVYINRKAGSDPRLPFGGIGKSGYGRELSIFGIREFVNVKTVWID